MPRYIVSATQIYNVRFAIAADSPADAVSKIADANGEVAPEATLLSEEPRTIVDLDLATADQVGGVVTDMPAETFRIDRPKSMPVVFEGWRLCNVDSRDFMDDHARKTRDRWSDLSIYKTTTGRWVVAQIGKTRETGGFRPGALVSICDTPPEVQAALMHRSGHWTPVTTYAINEAINADPELATAREEHI